VPLVLGAAALLVIAMVATGIAFVMTRPSREDAGEPGWPWGTAMAGAPSSTGPSTCLGDPMIEAESIDLTSDGLLVSVIFMSSCAGGLVGYCDVHGTWFGNARSK
jgi:hypothetical protein